MRLLPSLCVGFLLAGSAVPGVSFASAEVVDKADLPSSQFSVQDKTQIPGVALEPGSYSIKMLDHLPDRMVMQVENEQGKLLATFLGLPNGRLQRSGTPGAIVFNETRKGPALRGFQFANGSVVEFVYPKSEAVTIAKLNSTRVPAIDPPSEGMPSSNRLSRNDMALVTLWMLSPSLVGPEAKSGGIAAERYQAPVAPRQPEVEIARAVAPAVVVPPSVVAAPQAVPQPRVAVLPRVAVQPKVAVQPRVVVAPRAVAAVEPPVLVARAAPRKPVLQQLPHTAGFLPMVWLAGFLSLTGALFVRFGRRSGFSESL